jgi:hypothetical protein
VVAQEETATEAPQIAAAIAAGAHPQSAKEDKKAHKEVGARTMHDARDCMLLGSLSDVVGLLVTAAQLAYVLLCTVCMVWRHMPAQLHSCSSSADHRSCSGCMVLR